MTFRGHPLGAVTKTKLLLLFAEVVVLKDTREKPLRILNRHDNWGAGAKFSAE